MKYPEQEKIIQYVVGILHDANIGFTLPDAPDISLRKEISQQIIRPETVKKIIKFIVIFDLVKALKEYQPITQQEHEYKTGLLAFLVGVLEGMLTVMPPTSPEILSLMAFMQSSLHDTDTHPESR